MRSESTNGNALTDAVEWRSDDAAIASVDSRGLATARQNGSVRITATAGSATGAIDLEVAQVVSSVVVSQVNGDTDPVDLTTVGDQVQLLASARDEGGAPVDRTPTWSASDSTVVKVDGDGLVTGLAEGESFVKASDPTYPRGLPPMGSPAGSSNLGAGTVLSGRSCHLRMSAATAL